MSEIERTHRVITTPRAAALLRQLQERHGALLFHLSGGCCDGTVPLCLRQAEFRIGARDVLFDIIEGVPFYVDALMFPYLREEPITLDVVPAVGDSFSLEAAEDMRFTMSTPAPGGACCRRP